MTDASKKRQRPSWKDLPAFLDASASVSATTFGARRLPEIKSLWSAVDQQSPVTATAAEYQSGGGKTSSRHLRRRTTSHATRKRHRYPKGKASFITAEGDDGNDNQAAATSKNQKHDKQLPSRRARRKRASLREQHESWQSDSSNVVHWLTTHLWHAKRFHMHPGLCHWKVPLLHSNRGVRSALRMAAEQETLLQDVTWRMQPLVLGASELKTLISSLGRICPNLITGNNDPNDILSGCCFGEGILHEPDRFPVGAIGPAMWWVCRKPLDSSSSIEEEMWWMHIFVHPAVRDSVRDIMIHMAADAPSPMEGPRDLQGGIACFQLRGQNATKSLNRALVPASSSVATNASAETNCYYDWERTSTAHDLHKRLPHLTAISVRLSLGEKDKSLSQSSEKSAGNESHGSYIDSYKAAIRSWNPARMPGRSTSIGKFDAILIAQRPCDPSLLQNIGVCGWDLLCNPSDANAIFLALTETGEARAIGLVEEAHVRLESEPPLPVFPRDYPDTFAGQSYWKGDCVEWNLLRRCLEHGWGRVPVVNFSQRDTVSSAVAMRTISWDRISTLPENLETIESAAGQVVVRGEFGKPFLDVLAGCGHIPSDDYSLMEHDRKEKRRPRRRVRPSSASVPMQGLSNDEAAAHYDVCKSLLQSLSLPALIFSHVKIEGKGTIARGGRIYVTMNDSEEPGCFNLLLGEAVAGSFSTSRGFVHGVGFIGAGRLLHALSSEEGRDSGRVVKKPGGKKHVELKVVLRGSTGESCVDRSGTLSLLL